MSKMTTIKNLFLWIFSVCVIFQLFSCASEDVPDIPDPEPPTTDYQKPLTVDNNIVAHRGAFKVNNTPHNSIASLQDAIKLKLYASECDIHITLDGKVVVFHDDTFNGLDIDKTSYAQLKASGRLANGETLPLLEEYITTAMEGKYTKIWIDVKSLDDQYGGDANSIKAGEAATRIAKDMKAKYFVEFIVGREEVFKKCITAVQGDFPVAYMGNQTPASYQTKGYTWTNQTTTSFYPDNAAKIADFKSRGIRVSAYNADDISTIKWFMQQEVDQICTNDPELALKVLNGEI